MRFGKALLAVACTALFLLLLSALVVSPEADAPMPDSTPLVGARLMPLSLPMTGMGDAQAQRPVPPRVFAMLLLCVLGALPSPVLKRDANGRVLQAKRYENSFYQVFHPEIAGG